jgi:hypothetical protein
MVTHVGHTFVFQDVEDTGLISHRWKDHYPVRSHPPESFLHYFFLSVVFLDPSYLVTVLLVVHEICRVALFV